MTTAAVNIVGRRLPGRRWGCYRNIHVGVQCRSEVVGLVAGDSEVAEFLVPLDVRPAATSGDGSPGTDYRGPYVHGPRGRRFLYLSWGTVDAAGAFTMFRRAKVNFSAFPADIAAAVAAGDTVGAELDLTDRTGGPICAGIPADAIRWQTR